MTPRRANELYQETSQAHLTTGSSAIDRLFCASNAAGPDGDEFLLRQGRCHERCERE
jgi:hypothetical protein